MYALIESGGQQHKVEPGRYITVDRLPVEVGEEVVFNRVLMVRTDDGVAVGAPMVEDAVVRGRIRRHLRGRKIVGFKYKPKKGYRRRWGARADLTQVTILEIEVGGTVYAAEPQEVEGTETPEAAAGSTDTEEAVDAVGPEAAADEPDEAIEEPEGEEDDTVLEAGVISGAEDEDDEEA